MDDILRLEYSCLEQEFERDHAAVEELQLQLKEYQVNILEDEEELQQFKYTPLEECQLEEVHLEFADDFSPAWTVAEQLGVLCVQILDIRRNYRERPEHCCQQLRTVLNLFQDGLDRNITQNYLQLVREEVVRLWKDVVEYCVQHEETGALELLLNGEVARLLIE